jgi:hypothetical protein
MSSSPFPDHYERTCIDGKEHPADVVIGNLPRSALEESFANSAEVETISHIQDGAVSLACHRSRRELVVENAILRHRLSVPRRTSIPLW